MEEKGGQPEKGVPEPAVNLPTGKTWRTREEYNAYMKAYMREYRRKRKVEK